VALKTLPFAAVMDQKQVTRFKNEAQAAAGLHHPNIVPVYGVGCERGVHYFSMQLIEGQSLEQAIKQLQRGGEQSKAACPGGTTDNHFSTQKSIRSREFSRSVARLGQQAAEAIHYAHENGIVHRDVKPSNLLLDAGGKLWVTDFGLARITSASNLTVSGDMIGTARYMSPEQAAGRMHEVDHRSDIYSLGITLYELLTLHPAFDADTRQELLRAVEHEAPIAPRRLNPSIPVDLETIVLKAIEKDRGDRYSNAGELAEDLGHFLDGRPTLATRPGLREQTFRWATRHRNAVTAATAVILLALLLVSGAAFAIHAEQKQTKIEADRAALYLRETQRVVDNFGALVDQRLEHLPGSSPLRAELLGELEKYYSAFLAQANENPSFAIDLATTRFRLAAVHQRMGDDERAVRGFQEALSGFETLLRQTPNDADRIADVALCHNNLGQVAANGGDSAAARNEYQQAIDGYERLVALEHVEGRRGLGRSRMNLGLLLFAGRDPNAMHVLGQAHDSLKSLVSESPDDFGLLDQLALCENNLASCLLTSDARRAEDLLRAAADRYSTLVKERPASPEYRSGLALAIGNLSAVVAHRGDHQLASKLAGEAVMVRAMLVEMEPEVLSHRQDLAVAHQQLGQFFASSNQFEHAAESFSSASRLLRAIVSLRPRDHQSLSNLGRTISNVAMSEGRLGNRSRAIKLFQEAANFQQQAIDQSPSSARYRELLEHHRQQESQMRASDEIDSSVQTAGK
jgi:hypothetical protein